MHPALPPASRTLLAPRGFASKGETTDAADFDWKSGKVDFRDFHEIDESEPSCGRADHLKEDLARVSSPGGIVLDLGWYPSSIFQAEANDIPTLKHQIALAILSSA